MAHIKRDLFNDMNANMEHIFIFDSKIKISLYKGDRILKQNITKLKLILQILLCKVIKILTLLNTKSDKLL